MRGLVAVASLLGLGASVRVDESKLLAMEKEIAGAARTGQNGTAAGIDVAFFEFVHGLAGSSSPCDPDQKDQAKEAYAELVANTKYWAENVASRKCLATCIDDQLKFGSHVYRLKKCQALPVPEPAAPGAERSLAQMVWDEGSPLNLGRQLEEIYGTWQTIIQESAAASLEKRHCAFQVSSIARSLVELRKTGPGAVLAKWQAKPQAEIDALKAKPTRVPGSGEWHTCMSWGDQYDACGAFCCCRAGQHYVATAGGCQPWGAEQEARLFFALWDQIDSIADAAFGADCDWPGFSFRTNYLIARARAGLAASTFVTYQQQASWDAVELRHAEAAATSEGLAALLQQAGGLRGDPIGGGILIGAGMAQGGAGGAALVIIGIMMASGG